MLRRDLEAELLSLSGSDYELDEDGKPSFFIEKILDARWDKSGLREYKVKWKGLGYEQSTWEVRAQLEKDPLIAEMVKRWEMVVGKGEGEKTPIAGKERVVERDSPVLDEAEIERRKEIELMANRVPVGRNARRKWNGDPEYKIKRKEGSTKDAPHIEPAKIPAQEELFGLSKAEVDATGEDDWFEEANWEELNSNAVIENVKVAVETDKGLDSGSNLNSDEVFSASRPFKKGAKDTKKVPKKPGECNNLNQTQIASNTSKKPVEPTQQLKRSTVPTKEQTKSKCQTKEKETTPALPIKSFSLCVQSKEEIKPTLATVPLARDDYDIGEKSAKPNLQLQEETIRTSEAVSKIESDLPKPEEPKRLNEGENLTEGPTSTQDPSQPEFPEPVAVKSLAETSEPALVIARKSCPRPDSETGRPSPHSYYELVKECPSSATSNYLNKRQRAVDSPNSEYLLTAAPRYHISQDSELCGRRSPPSHVPKSVRVSRPKTTQSSGYPECPGQSRSFLSTSRFPASSTSVSGGRTGSFGESYAPRVPPASGRQPAAVQSSVSLGFPQLYYAPQFPAKEHEYLPDRTHHSFRYY